MLRITWKIWSFLFVITVLLSVFSKHWEPVLGCVAYGLILIALSILVWRWDN